MELLKFRPLKNRGSGNAAAPTAFPEEGRAHDGVAALGTVRNVETVESPESLEMRGVVAAHLLLATSRCSAMDRIMVLSRIDPDPKITPFVRAELAQVAESIADGGNSEYCLDDVRFADEAWADFAPR